MDCARGGRRHRRGDRDRAVAVRSTGTNDRVNVGGASTTVAATTITTTATVPTAAPSRPAPAALVEQVTSVPVDALRAVGAGTNLVDPVPLPGPTLRRRRQAARRLDRRGILPVLRRATLAADRRARRASVPSPTCGSRVRPRPTPWVRRRCSPTRRRSPSTVPPTRATSSSSRRSSSRTTCTSRSTLRPESSRRWRASTTRRRTLQGRQHGRDSVRRHREQVLGVRFVLRPDRSSGQNGGRDRERAERPVERNRARGRRNGQRHHRGTVHHHRKPTGERLFRPVGEHLAPDNASAVAERRGRRVGLANVRP